jgi:hypothetical protein
MKISLKKSVLAAVVSFGVLGLVACSPKASSAAASSVAASSTVAEITLGDPQGNFVYKNGDSAKDSKGAKWTVFVDKETKFHFVGVLDYTDQAASVLTYEGQITDITKNTATCVPVFIDAFLYHGTANDAATTAAKAAFKTAQDAIPDQYNGGNGFTMELHRTKTGLTDSGYFTTDFDLGCGTWDYAA